MKFSLRLVSVGALALATFGSTQALAAPGGGAIKAEAPCEITVPGFGDAVGTAKILITPSGSRRSPATPTS